MRRIQGMGWLVMTIVALGVSLVSQGCGDKTPAAPAKNPPPGTVAGKDWNYVSFNMPFGAKSSHTGLVYNSKMWVIGGFNNTAGILNDVWSSSNGTSWNQALANTNSPSSHQFTRRSGHSSVVFNNRMWVIGGYGGGIVQFNDTWSSSNGVSWTQELSDTASPGAYQFSQRYGQGSLVFNNKMWVIGGTDASSNYKNDVWSSSNGVSWNNDLADTASPGSGQFSQRESPVCLVYNDQMWVIGGISGGNALNDAWYSSDGVTWYQAMINNASPGANQFSQRQYATGLVYAGAMWVIGGADLSGRLNDVWYSTNGYTWLELTPSATFSARNESVCLAFNNVLWLLGGWGISGPLADAWYSPF